MVTLVMSRAWEGALKRNRDEILSEEVCYGGRRDGVFSKLKYHVQYS